MRRKLVKFFEWRGAGFPEELADEAIDRVCRRLAGGESIRSADPAAYFLGVARNLLREEWERQRRMPPPGPLSEAERSVSDAKVPGPLSQELDEPRMACLERCLDRLPPETRNLILLYYAGERTAKISGRKALAARLGIAPAALRIRVHRLRERLEECVRACLRGASETLPPPRPPTGGAGGSA